MNGSGPSTSQRLWSLTWAILALAVVVNLAWALLVPLLPVILVLAAVGWLAMWLLGRDGGGYR